MDWASLFGCISQKKKKKKDGLWFLKVALFNEEVMRESECLVLASSQAACDFFGLEFLRVRCCLSLYSRSSSACIITAG
ncbi:uncharacterized protein LOC110729365 isoform X2 [Chenopodium quinoa]|nr:uncharacterized protein LOC110729365 isoform X2 [Chenopodium quinoa]